MTTLKGINWSHRRATGPIDALTAAFQASRPDIAIEWRQRPLSDFEHQGIAGACAACDLIVFDHPFCGDIVAAGALVELGTALPDAGALLGADASSRYIGPSLETYRYRDGIWGVPVDGATQHAVYRADLMGDRPVPTTWDDVLRLGSELARDGLRLGMALQGPHGLLTAASLMANGAREWCVVDSAIEVDADALGRTLDAMAQLAALCPPEALDWNSIALHEAMVARDDVVFCPCVYGFATYGEADLRRRLSFAPFTGTHEPYDAGSTIGGTAIGVSASGSHIEAALQFAAFCSDPRRQSDLTVAHHGQPASVLGWSDPSTDQRFNGYFSAVGPSMKRAWIRPRCAGYPAFQEAAGQWVEGFLRGQNLLAETVAAVRRLGELCGK